MTRVTEEKLASGSALATLLGSPEWFRALSVRERLAGLALGRFQRSLGDHFDERLAATRFERWTAETAYCADPLFYDTVTLYGCSDHELRALLGESVEALQRRSPSPWWLRQLATAFQDSTPDWQLPIDVLPEEPDRGFLHVIGPVIEAAAAELRHRAVRLRQAYPHAPFDPNSVVSQFLPSVCKYLLTLVRPVLVVELHAARLVGDLRGSTPAERFDWFVASLNRPIRSLEILHRYPVLARLTVTILDAWFSSSSEFLERLARDWSQLGRTFSDRPDGVLVSVEPLGDRHRYGRRVMLARFETGFEIIYKPRSLRADKHFQELLRWFNGHTRLLDFRSLTILDCGDYGWEEVVHPVHCASRGEAARFYRRQGAYLALARALGAVDIHFENVIAVGEHPILVDLEPLFHRVTPPALAQLEGAERLGAEITSSSAMYVGMLPQRLLSGADSDGIDLSGLAADAESLLPVQAPGWLAGGTDEMHQFLHRLALGRPSHRPFGDESPFSLIDFVDDLLRGFTDAYRALLANRTQLFKRNGPLSLFETDETRCLLRPTLAYWLMFVSSCHPHFLTDGLILDRRFDRLLASTNECRSCARVISGERDALWQGDIPVFTTRTNSTDIWTGAGEPIRAFLPETGLEFVERRLHHMNEADLDRECWIIKFAHRVCWSRALLLSSATSSYRRRQPPAPLLELTVRPVPQSEPPMYSRLHY